MGGGNKCYFSYPLHYKTNKNIKINFNGEIKMGRLKESNLNYKERKQYETIS